MGLASGAAVAAVPETYAGTIEDLGCFAGGPRLGNIDLSKTGVSARRGHHSNEEIAAVIQGDFLPAVRENGGVGYFALESGGVFWCFDEARLGDGGRNRVGSTSADNPNHVDDGTSLSDQNIKIGGFDGAIQHIGGPGELQIYKVSLGPVDQLAEKAALHH